MRVGVLTGTGTYPLPGFEADDPRRVNTRFGDALVTEGRLGDAEVLHVSRHEPGPPAAVRTTSQHRANIWALQGARRRLRDRRDGLRRGRPDACRSARWSSSTTCTS